MTDLAIQTIDGFQVRPDEDEPRVRDVDLAERAGLVEPANIRRVIDANREELTAHGEIRFMALNAKNRGRPGSEYWLNEAQSYALVALMRTDRAKELRISLVRVFMLARQGQLVPTNRDTAIQTHLAAGLAMLKDAVQEEGRETRTALTLILGGLSEVNVKVDHLAKKRRGRKAPHLRDDVYVVAQRYANRCPCCQHTIIVDAGEPEKFIVGLVELDHWLAPNKNGATDMWPICLDCHKQRTEDKRPFHSAFEHWTRIRSHALATRDALVPTPPSSATRRPRNALVKLAPPKPEPSEAVTVIAGRRCNAAKEAISRAIAACGGEMTIAAMQTHCAASKNDEKNSPARNATRKLLDWKWIERVRDSVYIAGPNNPFLN